MIDRKWCSSGRHFFIVFFLGFSSGLPFSLVGTTLAAWFSFEGLSVMAVGMLSLVNQPYIFKFIWAPFLDRPLFKSIGLRKQWIALTQLLLIVTIIFLSFLSPKHQPVLVGSLALITAFISATQDIAIDAYRAEILLPFERGLGATLAVLGYRVATLFSGAAALVIADVWGWSITISLISMLLIPPALVNLYSREPFKRAEKADFGFFEPLKELVVRRQGIWVMIFIFLYKLGEAFTSTTSIISMPFLIQGLGFSLTTLGLTSKGVGILATIFGSVVAGFVMLRMRLFVALMLFGVLQVCANALFILLAIVGKNITLLIVAVMMDNFSAGMGMTALLAFMMAWCDSDFTASQFALLSAIAALPRMVSGPIAALIQGLSSWVGLYTVAWLLSIPALIILVFIRKVIDESGTQLGH